MGSCPPGEGSARDCCLRSWHPHLLDLVELPYFRPEDVDDHVPRIDQHPVTDITAFRAADEPQPRLEPIGEFLRNGRDLACGTAARDDHVVREIRLASEGNGDDILRLVIVE